MARRRYQRGSLIPTKGNPKDGLWRGRWREDVIENGKIRRKYLQEIITTVEECPTRRLAQRALEDRLRDVNSKLYRPTATVKFKQLVKEWRQSYLPMLNKSVQASEGSRLDRHLLPFFGEFELKEVNSLHIQRFIVTSGCSAKTVKNNINLMRQLHKLAVKQRYVGKEVDWFEDVKLPKIQKREMPHFSPEEIVAIINGSTGKHRTFYWILGETGMRLGECCGLQKSALIFERNLVVIKTSAWQGHIGPTKSDRPRTFPISTMLREHLRQFTEAIPDGGYLFSTKNNTPWNGSDLVKDHLRPLLLELGIWTECEGDGLKVRADVGAHAFRHGNCSIMLNAGISPKIIQQRLGHSNFERMSLEIYGHAASPDQVNAAEVIGAKVAPVRMVQ